MNQSAHASPWLCEPPESLRYRTDFLLLDGAVPLEKALNTLAAVDVTRVVIQAEHGGMLLLRRDQLLGIAPWRRTLNADRPLAALAAQLAGAAVDIVEEDPRYGSLPPRCIVVRGGWIQGYRDETEDPVRGVEPSQGADPSAKTRACTLRADAPPRLSVKKQHTIRVTLTPGERQGAAARVAVTEGRPLTLVLSCFGTLRATGESVVNLELTAAHGPEHALQAEFGIMAESAGAAGCQILALQNGRLLGALSLSLSSFDEPLPDEGPRRHEHLISPEAVRAALAAAGEPTAVEILVRRERLLHTSQIHFWVSARSRQHAHLALNYREFVSAPIDGDLSAALLKFLESLEQIPEKSRGNEAHAALLLELLCRGLTEQLLPAELLALLASLCGVVDALHVQSEEPALPWEMLLLDQPGGGVHYLCEAFVLTRWFPGRVQHPTLSLRRVSVVAPDGSDNIKQEKEYLLALPSCTVGEITSTWLKVMEALRTGDQTVVHFTGHGNAAGASPQDAWVVLSDGEKLSASQVYGMGPCLVSRRPMIVLNGCRTGRLGYALTGLSGWAESLCRAGAAAFIGTRFTVNDRAALDFTKELYRLILDGTPLGIAVQKARLFIRKSSDPSWLSYTVFCDPAARF